MGLSGSEKFIPLIFFGVFLMFFFLCFVTSFLPDLFYFDLSPAKGSATGYISYQEKSGIFQLDQVCWKDTQYDYCEFFDPDGKSFEPGKYKMQYECSMFVWGWEHSSECKIVNATKIGDI